MNHIFHRFPTEAPRPPRLLRDIIREMSQDPNSILSAYRHLFDGPQRENNEKGGER